MSIESTDAMSRIAAPFNGLRREVSAWSAERQEAEAFRRAGQEIANSRSVADDDRFDPFFAALAAPGAAGYSRGRTQDLPQARAR